MTVCKSDETMSHETMSHGRFRSRDILFYDYLFVLYFNHAVQQRSGYIQPRAYISTCRLANQLRLVLTVITVSSNKQAAPNG